MLSTGVSLSVVIPAFNEARRLGDSLPVLRSHLDPDHSELIVVDDGSADDTAAVASAALEGVPHGHVLRLAGNAGKGAAVRIGVSKARGAAVVFMDADMATHPAGLAALLTSLGSVDVAIGSRAHPASEVMDASQSRVLMGRAFNRLVRASCSLDHRDTQCGFKGFRGPVAKALFHLGQVNGFAFDVELLLLARLLGLRVKELPVQWTAVDGSTVRPFRHPLPMAADVLRSRLRWRATRSFAAVTALGRADEAEALAGALRAGLRSVDSVTTWERGAVAVLPCTGRDQAQRVAARMRRVLPGVSVRGAMLAPDWVLPPTGGLLRAALAA